MDFTQAAKTVAVYMQARQNLFTVTFDTPISDISTLANALLSQACAKKFGAEQELPNQLSGEIMWYTIAGIDYGGSYANGAATVKFCINYYDQAPEFNAAVETAEGLVTSLGLLSMEKPLAIKAAYEWIANNAVYDISTKSITWYNLDGTTTTKDVGRNGFSDVLTEKKSVCQGFSNAVYWFVERIGTDCRIIQGSEFYKQGLYTHAWNAAKIGDYYYYIDSTAAVYYVKSPDNGPNLDAWLLKNTADFCSNPVKYTRLPGFAKSKFTRDVPITPTSYVFNV